MSYLRNKIAGVFMIAILSITFLPLNTQAERTCEEKKEDCFEECDALYGDSDIVAFPRAVCKGGCEVATLICNTT